MCNLLELAEPGVGHDGSHDGRQVTESHEGVVDGGGKVIIPAQKVLEVQHQHGCTRGESIDESDRVLTSFPYTTVQICHHVVQVEVLHSQLYSRSTYTYIAISIYTDSVGFCTCLHFDVLSFIFLKIVLKCRT